MPKKKNTSRQGAGDDSAQEGGHEEASGASISAACGLPPQPIPSAPDQDDSAEDTSRPADGEGTSSLPSGMIVAGTSETRYISCVPYCDVCSMPFEYCEWSPLFKKCKENFQDNWQKHFPSIQGDEELTQLMSRLGFEGGDAASKKAQSTKKPANADGSAQPQNKKKEKSPPEVLIELNNRNKKKHITVIKGLDRFDVDTAAAAKLFGKKFACGSSLKKAQDGQPESIEIQGNYRDELPTVIVEKLKLSRELIVVVVDGKRMKATELPE